MKETFSIEEPEARRTFLAKALEVTSLIPLGILGVDNLMSHQSYQVLDATNASLLEKPIAQQNNINNYFQSLGQLNSSLSELDSAYHSAYRRTRVVPEVTVVDNETKVELRTEHYWEEESNAPDYRTISEFQTKIQNTCVSVKHLTNGKHVDASKLKEIIIKTERGDVLAEQLLTGLIYGGEAYLLFNYEELLAKNPNMNNDQVRETVDQSLCQTGHTRRSLIKVVAALAGGIAAYKINNGITERLSEGESRLKNDISDCTRMTDANPRTSISDYFNKSLNDLKLELHEQITTSEAVTAKGLNSKEVQSSFKNLKQVATQALKDLEEFEKNPTEVDQLAYLCLCANVTKRLEISGSADATLANTGHVLESLSVAATMLGICLSGEYLLQRFNAQK